MLSTRDQPVVFEVINARQHPFNIRVAAQSPTAEYQEYCPPAASIDFADATAIMARH